MTKIWGNDHFRSVVVACFWASPHLSLFLFQIQSWFFWFDSTYDGLEYACHVFYSLELSMKTKCRPCLVDMPSTLTRRVPQLGYVQVVVLIILLYKKVVDSFYYGAPLQCNEACAVPHFYHDFTTKWSWQIYQTNHNINSTELLGWVVFKILNQWLPCREMNHCHLVLFSIT